jgi:glycerophosphoryl diester phosphodiesterase
VLDRAQRPVVAVDTDHADPARTRITLDGEDVEAGTALDLTTLAAGEHTLIVEARGASDASGAAGATGTATATSTFVVTADQAGLGHLILTSGGRQTTVSVLLGELARGKYALLAKSAEAAARLGGLPADAARRIAADARLLASDAA